MDGSLIRNFKQEGKTKKGLRYLLNSQKMIYRNEYLKIALPAGNVVDSFQLWGLQWVFFDSWSKSELGIENALVSILTRYLQKVLF